MQLCSWQCTTGQSCTLLGWSYCMCPWVWVGVCTHRHVVWNSGSSLSPNGINFPGVDKEESVSINSPPSCGRYLWAGRAWGHSCTSPKGLPGVAGKGTGAQHSQSSSSWMVVTFCTCFRWRESTPLPVTCTTQSNHRYSLRVLRLEKQHFHSIILCRDQAVTFCTSTTVTPGACKAGLNLLLDFEQVCLKSQSPFSHFPHQF